MQDARQLITMQIITRIKFALVKQSFMYTLEELISGGAFFGAPITWQIITKLMTSEIILKLGRSLHFKSKNAQSMAISNCQ
jgi:hypothetical protein